LSSFLPMAVTMDIVFKTQQSPKIDNIKWHLLLFYYSRFG
jgi:hypothetical protein